MTKINIGRFELDSTKLPKEGLDYSKFDENTRNALSVFDTDSRKGHLSKAELQKAISFFASQDGIKENRDDGDYITHITHKKDGKLDEFETQSAEEAFNKKTPKVSKAQTQAAAAVVLTLLSKFIEEYKSENNGKMPSDELLELAKEKFATLAATATLEELGSYNMHDAVAAIGRAVAAEKKGLKATDIEGVYQSKDNKYYTFVNGEFYPANKKGDYRINEQINDKGQKFSTIHDKDGNILSVQALNYENKPYKNPKYAAKVLNLEYNENSKGKFAYGGESVEDNKKIKEGWNGYAEHDYVWDEKRLAFVVNHRGHARNTKVKIERSRLAYNEVHP